MESRLSPFRIAIIYVAFGALWILLSDTILHALVQDAELEARLQTFKGWAYVGITGALVYALIRRFAQTVSRARAELRESENNLSRHLENTPLGCASWNTDFICTQWNKAAEDIFGFTAEEVIGRHPVETILPEAIKEELDSIFRSLLEQQGGTRNVNENITKDGRTILCDWYNTTIIGDDGKAVGVASLVMDITEKNRNEEILRQAKEEAQAASRAKSEFLATMSHEFRTPLNAILGFSEMMFASSSREMQVEKCLDYAKDIHTSGKHMLSLVNDVLDLSQIEAGVRNVDFTTIDIAEILTACVKNIEPLAGKADVIISLDLPDDLPAFKADARAVNQIVINLLSNAVKFTDAKGSVAVAAWSDGAHVAFSIRDTGIGIAAADLGKIFEPFSCLNQNPMISQMGTGLGLSIVKVLVDLHGGEIVVESEPGVGTVVTVTLPTNL